MLVNCKKDKVHNAGDISKIINSILESESEVDQEKEHFWAIGLTTNNRIKYIDLVTLGTLNEALIHPRETFRLAVLKGVNCLIVCHNHPSGNLEASTGDIEITERLKKAGDILGIKLIDHIIIGDGFYSFQSEGLI